MAHVHDTIPPGLCQCGCGKPTPIISQTDTRRGRVKGQPSRFCPGHSPRMLPANLARARGVILCRICNTEKPVAAFADSTVTQRRRICKECSRQVSERWRKECPEKARATARRVRLRRYGLTVGQYGAMLAAQAGVCAICRKPESRPTRNGGVMALHVDHDHSTGRVRGLLCNACNRAVGLLGDDAAVAARAAGYLKRHQHEGEPWPRERTAAGS